MIKNGLDIPRQTGTFTYPYIKSDKKDFMIQKVNEAQEIKLDSEENILLVSRILLNIINVFYMPMFEKFATLEVLDREVIQKLSHQEIANYVSSPMPYKKLIIMKICNNPGYENYRDWFQDVLKESTDEEEGKQYFQLFIDLRDHLEREF